MLDFVDVCSITTAASLLCAGFILGCFVPVQNVQYKTKAGEARQRWQTSADHALVR